MREIKENELDEISGGVDVAINRTPRHPICDCEETARVYLGDGVGNTGIDRAATDTIEDDDGYSEVTPG